MKSKLSKSQIKETLQLLGADKVIFKKTGIIEFKRSYFYRHGDSPEKYWEKISAKLPEAKLHRCRDEFKQWPQTSYFIVEFTL